MYKMRVEVDQVWETRTARRDGTRERVKILALSGREARVLSENPQPGKPAERNVAIGMNCGHIQLGGMRLVQHADGTPFVAGNWPD